MIIPRFIASFRELFPDLLGRSVLIALSGGADSVALLWLMREARAELGCRLFACHVHHHVRGREADDDAAFCVEAGRALDIRVLVEHLDPRRPQGASPEAWWRRERYRLLDETRQRLGCAAVATAHTRDDQAETLIVKLLRGAGPRGLAGIRPRHGSLIRPLLPFGREELRGWLAGRGGAWREDSSNQDVTRPRAQVRYELLPLLRKASPQIVEHLAALADVLAEEDAVLGNLLHATAKWPEVGVPIELDPVRQLPVALQRRWLLQLAEQLPLAEPPSRRQLAAFRTLLARGRPAAVDLGRRWVVRRRGHRLYLSPPPVAAFAPVAARVPSRLDLPGGFVGRLGQLGDRELVHRTCLSDRLAGAACCWRSMRPGERLDGGAARSVGEELARSGVPAEWRRGWPVLEADGTMVWAPGVGVASGWDGDETGVVAELEEPWQRHGNSFRKR